MIMQIRTLGDISSSVGYSTSTIELKAAYRGLFARICASFRLTFGAFTYFYYLCPLIENLRYKRWLDLTL